MSATSTLGARLRESDFDSFVDQEAGLDGWNQIYRQLSPGPFRGHVAALGWDRIALYRETVNRQMENLYEIPKGQVCIGFSLRALSQSVDGRGPVPSGSALIYVPGEEYRLITDADADYLMLSLPDDCVPDEFLASSGRVFRENGGATAQWMAGLLESARRGLASDSLLALAPDMLLDQISLWAARVGGQRRMPRPPRGLVYDILAACEALPPETLTVTELSRVLQRDRADLRRAWQQHTGRRLDEMLKGRRLSEVYRRLHMADPHEVRVSDVSMEFGYFHWGRFAQDYRGMFGERPSDTLRRPAPRYTRPSRPS